MIASFILKVWIRLRKQTKVSIYILFVWECSKSSTHLINTPISSYVSVRSLVECCIPVVATQIEERTEDGKEISIPALPENLIERLAQHDNFLGRQYENITGKMITIYA